jgi:hypothetical protein
MLLSHVLASLCHYISSKSMHSYIPTPFGTPSVSYARFFQVVPPSDIISKWLIPMWCQKGREEQPRRYAMIKRLHVISTSGNVTRTNLSYLLSFKLPPCMICSKFPSLTNVCSCALDFRTIILCIHLGELSLYHASLMSL